MTLFMISALLLLYVAFVLAVLAFFSAGARAENNLSATDLLALRDQIKH